MALRLLEIVVPTERVEQVRASLEDLSVHDVWQHDLEPDQKLVRVLVETTKAEPILDVLQKKLGWSDGFRILLLPVEATIPKLDKPPPPEPTKVSTPERISRAELLQDLADGTRPGPIFLATTLLSAVVASVGLMRDNVAIIIGAMVIAPLLTPNMALALATTLGDLKMMRAALVTNGIGVGVAFLFALLVGAIFDPFSDVTRIAGEVLTRTEVGHEDLVLALAAGTAGALAFTSGVPAGLVGVMVAVALMPPLVVLGMAVGAGEMSYASRALLLLSTNVICVNLAGVSTFLVQGIRPATWWEADKARRATKRALLLWGCLALVLAVLISLIV